MYIFFFSPAVHICNSTVCTCVHVYMYSRYYTMYGMKCMEYTCFVHCFPAGLDMASIYVLWQFCLIVNVTWKFAVIIIIIMHVDQLIYNCYANLTSAVFYVCELPMDPPCAFDSVHLVGLQSARS